MGLGVEKVFILHDQTAEGFTSGKGNFEEMTWDGGSKLPFSNGSKTGMNGLFRDRSKSFT